MESSLDQDLTSHEQVVSNLSKLSKFKKKEIHENPSFSI